MLFLVGLRFLYTCLLMMASVVSSDEFNRVIIPVKRGEENTDYVNASFIDVRHTTIATHTHTRACMHACKDIMCMLF